MAVIKKIALDCTLKNEVIINIENHDSEPMMDKIMLKFPNLAEDILKELENECVANFRKISKPWCKFIDNEKFVWIRKISMYRGNMQKFNKQWNKVIRRTSVENAKELSITVQQFFHSRQNKQKQWSPLHIAAENGNFQFFRNIFEKTGNENPDDGTGITPFHFAAENGHLEICSLILGNVGDKNPAANNNGYTPLHFAARNGHLDVCKLIVESVEDKNPESFNGTPLHLAAQCGHFKICRLFVANGADKKQIFNGKTPFDMAVHSCYNGNHTFDVQCKEEIVQCMDYLKTCLFLMNSFADFGHIVILFPPIMMFIIISPIVTVILTIFLLNLP